MRMPWYWSLSLFPHWLRPACVYVVPVLKHTALHIFTDDNFHQPFLSIKWVSIQDAHHFTRLSAYDDMKGTGVVSANQSINKAINRINQTRAINQSKYRAGVYQISVSSRRSRFHRNQWNQLRCSGFPWIWGACTSEITQSSVASTFKTSPMVQLWAIITILYLHTGKRFVSGIIATFPNKKSEKI